MEGIRRMKSSRLLPALRVCLGVFLGSLCLAAQAEPQDIIFVFDNSGSMRKSDPGFVARAAAREFLASLTGDRRIGVLVFDDKVAETATFDKPEDLAKALDRVDYRGRFTNSPAAVERAMYELKQNGRPEASKLIVFMTDGIVDTGNPALDAERSRWLREDLTREAASMQVRIFGMAFTESADIQLMQALSSATGATFERAYTPTELPAAFTKLHAAIDNPALPIAPVAGSGAPATPAAAPMAEQAAARSPESRKLLQQMSPEDRGALEQMARETGTSLEQLLKEFSAGQKIPPSDLKGEVVVPPAAATPASAPPSVPKSSLPLILGSVVLAAGGAGAFFFLRKRGSGSPKAASGGTASVAPVRQAPVQIPEAWLIDIDGHAGLPPHRLSDKPLMVGRIAGTDTDFTDHYVVDKATIGRRHAVIRYRDGGFWLIEQGSVNGTFINGVKVTGEQQLRNSDRIRFHKFDFEFQLPGGSSAEGTIVGAKLDQTIMASVNETLVAASATALGGGTVTAPPPASPQPPLQMSTVVQKLPLRSNADKTPPVTPAAAPPLRPIEDKAPQLRPIEDKAPPLRPLEDKPPQLRPLEDKAPALRPLDEKPALRPQQEALPAAATAPDPDSIGMFDEDDMTGMASAGSSMQEAAQTPAQDFDLLGETVHRTMSMPESTMAIDPLGETFIRPDADAPTPAAALDANADADADASGFFSDFTMNTPSSTALESGLDDADLVPLDITMPPPPAEQRAEETAPSRDFYTATTIIPAVLPSGLMMEDTTAFQAASAEPTPEGLDDFFEIDPPIAPAPAAPLAASLARVPMDNSDLEGFDMEMPVADQPVPGEIEFEYPDEDELASGEAPLREDTVVLPSSPLTRGRGHSDS